MKSDKDGLRWTVAVSLICTGEGPFLGWNVEAEKGVSRSGRGGGLSDSQIMVRTSLPTHTLKPPSGVWRVVFC